MQKLFTSASFAVQVIARDGGLEPRSSNTTIFITVTDVNDNDPVITNIESGTTTVPVTEVSWSISWQQGGTSLATSGNVLCLTSTNIFCKWDGC